MYNPTFRGGKLPENQGAYMVYCDIYRNGELIDKRSFMLPELTVMDKDDPALEDTLFALADDYLRKHFERRIAEDVLQDPVACGDVAKGGSVQFEFTEYLYGTRIYENYENFSIQEEDNYLLFSCIAEEYWEAHRQIGIYPPIPQESEYKPPQPKMSHEEAMQQLKEMGLEVRTNDEE